MQGRLRVLLAYALDEIETWPADARDEAFELIKLEKYRPGSQVVDDEQAENWGTNYTLDLLPDDGRVIRVATVHLSQVTNVDSRLAWWLTEETPDNPSTLVDPPE